MEESSDIPGVTHVKAETSHGNSMWMTSLFVHHQLTKEEAEQAARALELLLPSILRVVMSL